MITLRICIYFDLLVILGKSVSWHPARTGCFPLSHILGDPTCWHCSCLTLSGLVAMQSAVFSHPHPLTHMGWARQTAGFSRDPQKSSPSFAAVLARSASRAWGKPSISIPLPDTSDHLWLSHGTRIRDQTQWNGYTALIQAQKNRMKNGGTLSAIWWQPASYRSQNGRQDKSGTTNGIVFQHRSYKASCWRETIW